MTDKPVMPSDVTGDDRLWVLLCFLLTPIVPIITLLMSDKKDRPFIKFHAVPTLVLGVAESAFMIVLGLIPFVGCLGPLVYIINIIYALKANKGEYVEIPVVTNFAKNQGWM